MIGKLVALLGAIALICYQGSQIHKWHQHSLALSAKLDAISSKRNEQKIETAERIKVVTRTIHEADGKARVIEAAPLPGNCKSPKEVLNADI
jgi:predicted negative regulator of RcsB-dependent stress response